MIPCTTTTIGSPLNYCGTDTYGNGTLNIGAVDPAITDALVVIENIATGRTSFHAATINAGVVDIDFPEGLSAGQMYRISIEVDGSEVMFNPYTFDGTQQIIGTVSVSAVHVNLRKYTDEAGAIVSTPTQWLSV